MHLWPWIAARQVDTLDSNALEDEFSLAAAMIQARAPTGLTQERLAERR